MTQLFQNQKVEDLLEERRKDARDFPKHNVPDGRTKSESNEEIWNDYVNKFEIEQEVLAQEDMKVPKVVKE